MKTSTPEKEKLLSMLTEIHDQLEELESVLESSFSNLRHSMNEEELNKMIEPKLKLLTIQNELEQKQTRNENSTSQITRAMKLEMGY